MVISQPCLAWRCWGWPLCCEMAVVVFLTLDEVHSNICVHKLRGNHFLVELQSKRNNGVLFGASS